jgi:ParB family chromosome partitioning protein
MSSKSHEPYTAIKKPVDLLLGSSVASSPTNNQSNATNTIAITKIKLPPLQHRRYFHPQKLEELSRSIKELGILEPLLVRPLSGGNYELVAGERRYKAASMAGLTEIPVVVREMDEATTHQVRLVENLQREDLNPLEETEGILELLALRLEISQDDTVKLLQKMENEAKGKITRNVTGNVQTLLVEEVFTALGCMKWDSFVRNRLPLLNLPPNVLEVLRSGKLEYTKARAIARVKDKQERQALLAAAISEDLSLAQIKQRVASITAKNAVDKDSKPLSLKSRIKAAYRFVEKSNIWDEPNKQKRLEKLLTELEALISQE